MKITVEIDESIIEQNVTDIVSKQIASELHRELAGRDKNHLSYRYHVDVRAIIREVLKDNLDAITREAVSATAKTIERKALKDKLKEILEE